MKNIFTLFILFCAVMSHAQDVIYKKDNTKIEAKILEINPMEIKYKMFSNPEGPLYIIYKSDVVKIEYPNGQVDVYNPEIKKEASPVVKDDYVVNTQKPKNALFLNGDLTRNIVSLNLLQVMLGFVSASYEWVEPKGMFGIKIPLGYAFDDASSFNLVTMSENTSQYFAGLALNIYPSRKRRAAYVVGPHLQVGQYSYTVYQYNSGWTSTAKRYDDGVYYALYINNGMEILLSKNFSFSFCGGPGIIRRTTPQGNNNNDYDIPISLNGEFNLSYRF